MNWRTFVAGALASVVFGVLTPSLTLAEVRISGDPGGEVAAYLQRYQEIRDSGQRIVIDGPCLSACTLLTGIVPRNRVCVTGRAMLGFHAASYYDDASQELVPTRAGSRMVMRIYPAEIRHWIERHGGLTPHMIRLRGRELTSLYQTCR